LEHYVGLVDGSVSREAAARWAESLDRRATSFGERTDPGLWWEAFLSLAAANTRGDSVFSVGGQSEASPYFLRDGDISEWLANLTEEPLPDPDVGPWHRFRIWEATSFVQDSVATIPSLFASASPPGSLRGVDDLDYFEELDLVLPSGRLAVLRQHRGVPDTTVHLQFEKGEAASAPAELLEVLALSASSVRWRSQRYFQRPAGAV
jgi:hypothetical protein